MGWRLCSWGVAWGAWGAWGGPWGGAWGAWGVEWETKLTIWGRRFLRSLLRTRSGDVKVRTLDDVARGDVAVASPAEMSPGAVAGAGAVASPADYTPAEMSLATGERVFEHEQPAAAR
jgi:hypothetical protein